MNLRNDEIDVAAHLSGLCSDINTVIGALAEVKKSCKYEI